MKASSAAEGVLWKPQRRLAVQVMEEVQTWSPARDLPWGGYWLRPHRCTHFRSEGEEKSSDLV